jgi:hypothetical protein
MHRYLYIQNAPVTDNITDDGTALSKRPWPVVADEDGVVHTPSYALGMRQVFGFQRDLAVQHVDLRFEDAYADPEKAVGMYMVSIDKDGVMGVELSAVDHVSVLETTDPLPLD